MAEFWLTPLIASFVANDHDSKKWKASAAVYCVPRGMLVEILGSAVNLLVPIG